jgi:hypothetical protein
MAADVSHPLITQPDSDDIGLWRYMDLVKFLSFVPRQELHFSRLDKLGDPFEGSVNEVTFNARRVWIESEVKKFLPKGASVHPASVEDSAQQFSDHFSSSRREFYCSCWHMNEGESAAMWSLYSKSNESIAIKSTYATLKNLLPNNVFLGKIEYKSQDELIHPSNQLQVIFTKRKSFEHEREVRAVAWLHDSRRHLYLEFLCKESGIAVPISVNELVHSVHLNPECSPWFFEVVKDILDKYEISVQLQQSSLIGDPIF